MKSIYVFLVLFFTTHPLLAHMSIAIENIESTRMSRSGDQSFAFRDSSGQVYTIVCEKYLYRKNVNLFLLGVRFSAHFPDCMQTLKQVRNHIESGKKIDSIIVDISYLEGTKQAQAEMTFLSAGKPIKIGK